MNPENFGHLLTEASLEVLGDAAFTRAQVVDTPPCFPGYILSVSVDFRGPTGEPGWLFLWTSHDCGAQIACKMLGVDLTELESTSQIQTELCELLNMIGGAATCRWFGTQAICRIGIPRPTPAWTNPPPDLVAEVLLLTETNQGIKLSATLEGNRAGTPI